MSPFPILFAALFSNCVLKHKVLEISQLYYTYYTYTSQIFYTAKWQQPQPGVHSALWDLDFAPFRMGRWTVQDINVSKKLKLDFLAEGVKQRAKYAVFCRSERFLEEH